VEEGEEQRLFVVFESRVVGRRLEGGAELFIIEGGSRYV
jgi:hypothetical protein